MHITNREMATVMEALVFWEEWLNDEDAWIRDCTNFQTESPLSRAEVNELMSRVKAAMKHSACSFGEPFPTWAFPLKIPTYMGHRNLISKPPITANDFTDANVPVLISPAEGIRVVLGTHDYHDNSKPDLQIERRPHGWAIFVHPDAGDPVAVLYIHDNGQTFLVPENYVGRPLQIVDDIPPELDMP